MERVKIKQKIERVRLNPQFTYKQRVSLKHNPQQQGTIVKVGTEVSEVKWDNKSNQIYVTNYYLQPKDNNND